MFLTISNDAPTTLEPEINYLISTITPDWVMPRGVQIRRLSPAVRPVRSARELSDPITQNSFAQNHSKENQMRLNSSKETSEANLTHVLRDRIIKVLEHWIEHTAASWESSGNNVGGKRRLLPSC